MNIPIKNNINFGLDWEKTKQEQALEEKYIAGVRSPLGASEWPVLKPDGQWLDTWSSLPWETQFGRNVETMGCTGFGTANLLEMIWKWHFNKDFNLSDRFINKASGTTTNGNSVDAPIDTVRKKGFLFEDEWNWDRETFSWGTYYSPIPFDLFKKALARLVDWEFNHEYVPQNKDAMMNALKTSPLGCTVYAWASEGEIYKDYGYDPNHFTTIIGYIRNQCWLIGDSYPTDFILDNNSTQQEFVKKLDWNFNFGAIKRYKIGVKLNSKVCLYKKIIDMFKKISRASNGGLWFIKNNQKQKIENWEALAGALIDEIGVERNNLSNEQLAIFPDFKFFGE